MQRMMECDSERLSELFAFRARDWPPGLDGFRPRIDEEFEKPDTRAVRIREDRRRPDK